MRRARRPRWGARLLLRRLLIVGGMLVCGWLLSGLQSAHALDVAPPPAIGAGHAADAVQAVTARSATVSPVTTRAADPPAATRAAARPAGAATHPPAAHFSPAHLPAAHPAGAASPRSSTRLARTTAQSPAATGTMPPGAEAPGAARSVGSTAPRETRAGGLTDLPVAALISSTPSHQAAPAPATARHSSAAAHPASVLGSLTPAPAAAAPSVSPPAPGLPPALDPAAPAPPPPLQDVAQAFGALPTLDGLSGVGAGGKGLDSASPLPESTALDSLPVFAAPASLPKTVTDAIGVPAAALDPAALLHESSALDPLPVFSDPASLPRTVTDVIGSLSGIVQRPIDAVGALTGPLGTFLTTTGAKALGALTAQLKGVLGHLGGLTDLTDLLIPQVTGLLKPVTGVLEPIRAIGLPAGLAAATPIESVLRPASPVPACPAAEPAPTGDSWPTGVAPSESGHFGIGGSAEQQLANAPITSADQPSGAGSRAATSRVLSGQWPRPPHAPAIPQAHMSGQSTDPFSPGDPNVPTSGTSNRALPTSSQNDGGDTPHSWQAHVPDVFVPAGIVVSPAVHTAADEPAFSPD